MSEEHFECTVLITLSGEMVRAPRLTPQRLNAFAEYTMLQLTWDDDDVEQIVEGDSISSEAILDQEGQTLQTISVQIQRHLNDETPAPERDSVVNDIRNFLDVLKTGGEFESVREHLRMHHNDLIVYILINHSGNADLESQLLTTVQSFLSQESIVEGRYHVVEATDEEDEEATDEEATDEECNGTSPPPPAMGM